MANNMESMLLGDSSSDDDDEPVIISSSNNKNTAAAPVIPIAAAATAVVPVSSSVSSTIAPNVPVAAGISSATISQQQQQQQQQRPPPIAATSKPIAAAMPSSVGTERISTSANNMLPSKSPSSVNTSTAAAATGVVAPPPTSSTNNPSKEGGMMSPSEMANRLKSLYVPANRNIQQQQPAPVPAPAPAPIMKQQVPIQQAQQQRPQPQQQRAPMAAAQQVVQTVPTQQQQSTSGVPTPHIRPYQSISSSSNVPANVVPQPMQQQQPVPTQQRPLQQQQRPPQQQPRKTEPDPFAPTPLSEMMHKKPAVQQHQSMPISSQPQVIQQQQQQRSSSSTMQQHQQQSSHRPSSSTDPHHRAQLEREAKQRKEQFLMFTRVLMKYLEQKDAEMHARAKNVIRECAEKNKKGDPEYISLTASMKRRLRATVGDVYWHKAEDYLAQLLRQKRAQRDAALKKQQQLKQQGGDVSQQISVQQVQQHRQQQQHMQVQQQQQSTIPDKKLEELSYQRLQAKMNQDQQSNQPQTIQQQQQQASAAQMNAQNEARRKQIAEQKALAAQKKKQEKAAQRKMATKTQQAKQPNMYSHPSQVQQQQGYPANMTPHAQQQQGYLSPNAQQQAALQKKSDAARRAASSSTPMTNAAVPPTTTSTPSSSHATPQTGKKKQSTTAAGGTAQYPATSADKAQQQPQTTEHQKQQPKPEEKYKEFMEQIDHMTTYDLTTAPYLLSSTNISLSDEQKLLLYPNKDTHKKEPTISSKNIAGWSSSNIITPRILYPKVYPNQEKKWYNDEIAEQDPVLCLLSEASQVFLKQILLQGVTKARQRYNLDGIRLWHVQQQQKGTQITSTTDNTENDNGNKREDQLALRLGCDVQRQMSLVDANCCKIYQRLEEAIQRTKEKRNGNSNKRKEPFSQIFYNSKSMSDLSLQPSFVSSKVIDECNVHAKRKYDIYAGCETTNFPLGRVPKECKLVVDDFRNVGNFGVKRRRYRFNMNLLKSVK